MHGVYSLAHVEGSEAPDPTDLIGLVMYEGRSLLSEQRIVAVLTLYTENRKIGDMAQLWVLPRDVSPLAALKLNNNAGVCGRCVLQGVYDRGLGKMIDRVCYTHIGRAPEAVWQAYTRGRYPTYNRKRHANLIRGRRVRLGSYGDPAALPIRILRDLVSLASAHSGYSHQLFDIDRRRADLVAQYCMASCETSAQHVEAVRRGWRPFTVIRPDEQPPAGAVECPYYSRGVQCADCRLCGGTSRRAKPVYVIAHGKVGMNLGSVQDRLSQVAIA